MSKLPDCMMGPSEPCDGFTAVQSALDAANAELAELKRQNKNLKDGLSARDHDHRTELAALRVDGDRLREVIQEEADTMAHNLTVEEHECRKCNLLAALAASGRGTSHPTGQASSHLDQLTQEAQALRLYEEQASDGGVGNG